ncbi:Imm3 family immunity protein [Paenibacillus sp. PK1-4R]|uniref:Imm3 family immunity protein n=1 Tax=Paenibacillus sp. PK1-4R TaxID=3049075 RepID=UPI00338D71B7
MSVFFKKSIIVLVYGEILLTYVVVFYKSKECLLKELNDLSLHQLKDKLSFEQFNDLNTRRKVILENIEQKTVTTILD